MEIYQQHQIGACYPPLSTEEFDRLKEAAKDLGTKPPVILFEGKILDGWHWYKACTELGIEASFEKLEAGTDPAEFIIRRHDGRRHLSHTQKLLVAEKLANLQNGSNRYQQKVGTSHEVARSVSQISKSLGVPQSTVGKVRQVRRAAVPAVMEALEAEKIGPTVAYEISRFPKEKQSETLAAVMDKTRKTGLPSRTREKAPKDLTIEIKTGKQLPPEDHIPAHLLGGIITGDALVRGHAVSKDDYGAWCALPKGISKLQRDEEVATMIGGSSAFGDRKAYYKWQDYKDKNITEKILGVLSQIGPIHIPKVFKHPAATYQYNLEVSTDLKELVEMACADLMRRVNMLENRERFGHLFPLTEAKI